MEVYGSTYNQHIVELRDFAEWPKISISICFWLLAPLIAACSYIWEITQQASETADQEKVPKCYKKVLCRLHVFLWHSTH